MSNIRFEDYAGHLHRFQEFAPAPKIQSVYFPYKGGEAQRFHNEADALAFSQNAGVGTDHESASAVTKYWAQFHTLECEAVESWRVALRHTYANIPERVYDRLMSEAWERGHSTRSSRRLATSMILSTWR